MLDRLMYLLSGKVESPFSRRERSKPDVIAKNSPTTPSQTPRKFEEDIATLKGIYGEKFTTGLSISYSLQDILHLLPRERRRVDSYSALTKYLKERRGITLTIISNKSK